MKQLNVRLSDDIHAALVAMAADERRSLNSMIVVLIEREWQRRDIEREWQRRDDGG